jgi:hypothetical protein
MQSKNCKNPLCVEITAVELTEAQANGTPLQGWAQEDSIAPISHNLQKKEGD